MGKGKRGCQNNGASQFPLSVSTASPVLGTNELQGRDNSQDGRVTDSRLVLEGDEE
jgi:hypothetical protein